MGGWWGRAAARPVQRRWHAGRAQAASAAGCHSCMCAHTRGARARRSTPPPHTARAPSRSQPTNHLDLEAIDSLAEAIKKFNGGLVLVSHDFRLIDQVANEIWLCDNNAVTKWQGDIRSYKQMLAKKVMGK